MINLNDGDVIRINGVALQLKNNALEPFTSELTPSQLNCGLRQKYYVKRVDGKDDEPSQEYIVLKIGRERKAEMKAIFKYALEIRKTKPDFYQGLLDIIPDAIIREGFVELIDLHASYYSLGKPKITPEEYDDIHNAFKVYLEKPQIAKV